MISLVQRGGQGNPPVSLEFSDYFGSETYLFQRGGQIYIWFNKGQKP